MNSKALIEQRRKDFNRDLTKTAGLKSRINFIPSGPKRLREGDEGNEENDELNDKLRRMAIVNQLRLEYKLKPDVRINEEDVDDLLRERNDGVELKVFTSKYGKSYFSVFDGPSPWTGHQHGSFENLIKRLTTPLSTDQGQVSIYKLSFAPWNTREKGYKRFPYRMRKRIQTTMLEKGYVIDERWWNENRIFYGPLEKNFIRYEIMLIMEYLITQFERRGITFEILLSPSRFAEESTWVPIYRNGKLIDQQPEKQRGRFTFDTMFKEALAKL